MIFRRFAIRYPAFLLLIAIGLPNLQAAPQKNASGTNLPINLQPLDLSKFYTRSLPGSSIFPRGLQLFDGVPYQLGGRIEVTGLEAARRGDFIPASVSNIPVGQKALRILLLHGAAHGHREGVPLANVVFHYQNGETRKLRLAYGVHARNWIKNSGEMRVTPDDPNSRVAWSGNTDDSDGYYRLYQTALTNPISSQEIRSLDLVSLFGTATPVVFGITLDTRPSLPPTPKPTLRPRKDVAEAYAHPDETYYQEIAIRVLTAESKQPLTNATVTLTVVDDETSYLFGRSTSDREGRMVFPYPPQEATALRFLVRAPDRVPQLVALSRDRGLPRQWDIELPRGVVAGGVVHNHADEPIPGAQILIYSLSNTAPSQVRQTGIETLMSDSQGRWSSSSLPQGFGGLHFRLSHPEHKPIDYAVASPGSTNALTVSEADLLAKRGVLKMDQRIRVAGLVTAPNGKALTNAEINYRGPDYRQRVKMDEQGRFSFFVNEPSTVSFAFLAPGFAPELQVLNLEPGLKPIKVVLQKGIPLKVRVRDMEGNPVDGASVELDSWNTSRLISWQGKTDARGGFVWTNAPIGGFRFYVSRNGYASRYVGLGSPSDGEIEVVLKKSFRLTGNVVDAASKDPVPIFDVTKGHRFFADDPLRWDRGNSERYRRGQFSISLLEYTAGEPRVMIEAPGYLPLMSDAFTKPALLTNQFELKRNGGIPGTVLMPGGQPAAKASLIMAGPGETLSLDSATELRRSSVSGGNAVADDKGTFVVVPRLNADTLFATHPLGFGQSKASEVLRTGKIELQPWGHIAGHLKLGGKLASGTFVALHSAEHGSEQNGSVPISFVFRARTDPKGNFSFDRVPPGEWRLSLYYRLRDPSLGPAPVSHGTSVVVKSGETNSVDLDFTGRTIVGKVQASEPTAVDWLRDVHLLQASGAPSFSSPDLKNAKTELQRQDLLRTARQREQSFWASEKGRQTARTQRSYMLQFETNGTFRIENVPPGTYTLTIAPTDPMSYRYTNLPMGVLSQKLTVRDGPTNELVDLGTLKLDLQPGLRIGQAAPSFRSKTLNGHDIQLEDFRNKWLLLHFWATTSDHWLSDLDYMKSLLGQNGKSGSNQLAAISFNFDKNQKCAEAAARGSQTSWTQCLLGSSARLMDAYGMDENGGVVLVTPEGKVFSKGLHNDYIVSAVRRALSPKPGY